MEEHIEIQYCEKHPEREASLRCNRCNRLMCSKCAVHTPTGYRCVDCVRGQRKIFDTAQTQDFIIGPLVAGFLSLVGGSILPRFGFFILIIGATFFGRFIAEATRRVIGRRRSKTLFIVVTAAVVLAGLLPALSPIGLITMSLIANGSSFGGALLFALTSVGFSGVWNLVYAILIGGGTYYSLAGLKI